MLKNRELNNNNKIMYIKAFLKLGLLFIILVGIPIYIYLFHRDFIMNFSSLESVENYFQDNIARAAIFTLTAQILQVVICIIPGQWIQVGASYLMGFWAGFFLSMLGAIIGSIIGYYLARVLGQDAMEIIFGEKKFREIVEKLNSKKALVIMFVIFLMPGLPKDLLAYGAGLSNIKLNKFLIISVIGRTPAMMGSLLIGKQIGSGNYTIAIIIGVIASILFVLGFLFRNKAEKIIDLIYSRLRK